MLNLEELKYISNLCTNRNILINSLNNSIKNYSDCMKIINTKLYRFNIVWCFAWRILLLMGLSFIPMLFTFLKDNTYDIILAYIFLMILVFTNFMIPPLFILTLIFLIIKICKSISHAFKLKRAKVDIVKYEQEINRLQQNINEYSHQLSAYNFLPAAYWYAGDVIINYILNRRADTLKEAINLFEFECRQDKHFQAQMEVLQKINNQLIKNGKTTAISSAVIASAVIGAAGSIAITNAINK